MALLTLEGIYCEGTVKLSEVPDEVPHEARVLVTFLPTENRDVRGESEAARYEAGERLMALLKHGFHFGGRPYPTRQEIYDERLTRPG